MLSKIRRFASGFSLPLSLVVEQKVVCPSGGILENSKRSHALPMLSTGQAEIVPQQAASVVLAELRYQAAVAASHPQLRAS